VHPFSGQRWSLALQGVHQVYNAVAAVTAATALGIAPDTARQALATFQPAVGRGALWLLGGRPVRVGLVKNPAGTHALLGPTLQAAPAGAGVAFLLESEPADGRDISWIWDTSFQPLCAALPRLGALVAGGGRAQELALRWKYEGIGPERVTVQPAVRPAVHALLANTAPGAPLYLFATYTALRSLQRLGERGARA